jgi:hypothetical protein
MKYTVTYKEQPNKKSAYQKATFFTIEDASMWEKHVLTKGATNVKIMVC